MESTKSESLDPYLKWLGIRDLDRPPNHYRLLGIELLESDPDVIAAAADRQMAHVRRYQSGKYAELSQALLNELATAKLVLLDPTRKADYDGRFAAKVQRDPNQRLRHWLFPVLAACVGLAAIALLLAGYGDRNPKIVQGNPAEVERTTVPQVTDPSPQPNDRDGSPQADQPRPTKTDVASDNPEIQPPEDSDDATDLVAKSNINDPLAASPHPQFQELNVPICPLRIPETESAWNDVKLAISEGDVEVAKQELRALSDEIRTPSDAQTLNALHEIADTLDQFWRAVDAAFRGRVDPGTILPYGDSSVEVLAIDQDGIRLLAPNKSETHYGAGRNQLPPVIAAALAEKTLESRPDLNTIIGTFWEFDQRGNVQLAEQNWRVNRYYGDDADARFRKAWQTTPARSENVRPAKLAEIPNSKDFIRVQREVEQALQIDRRNPAPNAPDRLLEFASRTSTDQASQYVCRITALHYATVARRADLALQILDQIIRIYQVDRQSETLAWLKRLSLQATDPRSSELIATATVSSIHESINNDDFAMATKLKSIAMATASRSKSKGLIDQTRKLADRVLSLDRAYKKTTSARNTLENKPDDPTANDEVGRFYCLVKGDFEKGLPYLAKSGDRQLADLAKGSLMPPASLQERIDLADRWWDQAASLTPFESPQARQYAIHLYRLLQSETLGIQRTHVNSRLRSN